jgi:hypothetical protein
VTACFAKLINQAGGGAQKIILNSKDKNFALDNNFGIEKKKI